MTRSIAGTCLERAWGNVRRNRGATGIDRETIADVGQVTESATRRLVSAGGKPYLWDVRVRVFRRDVPLVRRARGRERRTAGQDGS